jgi:hypothetical protein
VSLLAGFAEVVLRGSLGAEHALAPFYVVQVDLQVALLGQQQLDLPPTSRASLRLAKFVNLTQSAQTQVLIGVTSGVNLFAGAQQAAQATPTIWCACRRLSGARRALCF